MCNGRWLGLVGLPGLEVGWLGCGAIISRTASRHGMVLSLVVIASARSLNMVSLYNTLDYTISSLDKGSDSGGRRGISVSFR
jgi:hypothetical protein